MKLYKKSTRMLTGLLCIFTLSLIAKSHPVYNENVPRF